MNSLPAPGTGYYVAPDEGPGPGILLLPSPWGLTPGAKAKAHALADAGFSVLVPDLNDGVIASDPDHARTLLLEADMNVTASLVQSSLRLLQAASNPTSPVGLIGYAAGASWALWLSVRFADQCAAVVGYYGTQSISFDEAKASYLVHLAEHDTDVSSDDAALLGLNLQMANRTFHIEQHAEMRQGFAEVGHPDFSPTAEAVAWHQTLEFLQHELRQASR